jgi:hypothetical protein
VWCCALAALALTTGAAPAAWNNVFQVCCNSCRSSNYVAAVPAAPAPAPCGGCQQCTTRYVQRCYYQPVTTYRQSCYMEPVTTYRTSYYYEPVTSYRYSCHYDPCTCSYQQVAQPVTSYRLRSQCCPVTSYLQRCCMQPVTSYQQAFYYEPVTTCCTTTVGAPVAAPPAGVSSVPAAPPPGVSSQPAAPPPGVSSQPSTPPPAVNSTEAPPPGQAEGMKYNSNLNNRVPRMPLAPDSSSFRQPRLQAPVPVQPATPTRVRFDRITSAPRHNTQGQVLRTDRIPQGGAKLLFVSADQRGARQNVTADGRGQFQTTLATGTWLIYVQDGSGRLVYQQKVQVGDDRPGQPITLVSR